MIQVIPDRICTKCGGNEWILWSKYSSCRNCRKEYDKKRWKSLPIERRRVYNNAEKARLYRATPSGKLSVKKGNRKRVDKVTDCYIRQTLRVMKKDNVDFSSLTKKDYDLCRGLILKQRLLKKASMETKKKIKIIEGRTWNEHVAFLKTLSPEERKERDRKKALDYQKEWQAKQRNKDFKIEVTTEDFNQLIEATTVGLVHEKNPEYVRRAQVAKANKETKLAAKTTPIVTTSSIGTLESLLNDLSTLKNKKEEILNHLESIKQLINQF